MAPTNEAQTFKVPCHSTQHHGTRFLEVPHGLIARSSQDTTFSELSNLSNELRIAGSITFEEDGASTSSTFTRSLNAFWLRNKGAIFILLAQFFSSCMNLATRILENPGSHGSGMHPFQLLFVRMLVTSLISMLYMWYAYMPEFPFGPRDIRPLLILRGLSGFFGVSGLYFSLVYLPISEAVVLTFLAPMLSCYLYSFLQPDEAFTRIHQFGAYISMVGVVFIARPDTLFASSSSSSSASTPTTRNTTTVIDATPHDALLPEPPAPTTSQHLFAIALAMMGVIGGAIALTTVRYIGKRAHPLISITYFSVWCTFVSSLSFIFIPGIDFKLPQNLTEWNLFFIVGITGFIMQVFLTVGLAYSTNNAPASAPSSTSPTPKLHTNTNPAGKSGGSKATAMMYTQMLFALLFDKIFWGTGPNLWSWIGSGLILGSVIWVSIQGEEDQDLRPSSQPQYPEGTEAMDPASPNHDDNGPVMQDQDLEMSYIARDTVRKGSVRVQERFVTEDNEEEEVRGLLDGSYDDVDPVDNIEGTCS